MLSVIIPNYNKELYLEQCLSSVMIQTYKDIEIIVVDDCSSDLSRSIIERLSQQDNRIKTLFLEKNSGVSNARNMGILNAKGEYVTMLDSDDYYSTPEKLANEMQCLMEHGGNCIAYSKRILVNERGERLHCTDSSKKYVSGENMLIHFLTEKDPNMYVQRDYVLPKKALIESGMYSLKSAYYEDYDLLLKLIAKLPIYYTEQDGTAYRIISTGLSHLNRKKYAEQFLVPLNIQKKYIYQLPIEKKVTAMIIWEYHYLITNIKIIIRNIYHAIKER